MQSRWYQNAVFYAVDIDVFRDTNGDGYGDFDGLTESLDYLAWLGVDALWLLPFYSGPYMDNGYDISNYYDVASRLGSLGTFTHFMTEAERRGIRVVLDLVVQHTSSQHPWFIEARGKRHAKYRDYYVWTQDPASEHGYHSAFPGTGSHVWQFDPKAGSYYLHRFYDFEPTLNTAHSSVQDEIHWIMDFWLRLGAAGFRVDAAALLRSTPGPEPSTPHPLLRKMRSWAVERKPDAPLIGEVDVAPDHLSDYFAGGDELAVLYNFPLAAYLFLAFAREQAEPIRHALKLVPAAPEGCQWFTFLRNLDELNLALLSDDETAQVMAAFAPDPRMRIFDRGIRRRLATMLGGDRRRIELAYSLLFSLPGSPFITYGDEIGMGEDLAYPERYSVRVPMQWSTDDPNGGFTSADPSALVRPVISNGPFGFPRVNVADQRRDPGSLLHWMRQLMHVRKSCPEIGEGRLTLLDVDSPSVFAHTYDSESATLVAVHNLSSDPQTVSIHMQTPHGAEKVLGQDVDVQNAHDNLRLRLPGYGYLWLRWSK